MIRTSKILFSTSIRLQDPRRGMAASSRASPSLCKKLVLLGGGKMAEAILNALKVKKVQHLSDVVVIDPDDERLAHLAVKYKVNTCPSANTSRGLVDADVVILAVKPQHVGMVSDTINGKLPSDSLLVSIVAGSTIDQLKNAFHTDLIVRSMPNTPASILEGITCWIATKQTPDAKVEQARNLLGALGDQQQVFDESYLDMATAVSGSGPAYIFLVMESLIDAAVHIGFPRDMAVKLVTQTIKGSASYAQHEYEKGTSVSELRYNVTSPGGTTASAVYELERGGFRTVMSDAVWAAYRRALELGGKNPNIGPGRNKFGQAPAVFVNEETKKKRNSRKKKADT